MLARRFASLLFSLTFAAQAYAAELIMVEQTGCHYCIAWKEDIGPIYPVSSEGQFAPLRMVQLRDGAPEDVEYARPVLFTPTFILVENGNEIGRIEGYPGEDFFWGLLEMMLKDKTDYQDTASREGATN